MRHFDSSSHSPAWAMVLAIALAAGLSLPGSLQAGDSSWIGAGSGSGVNLSCSTGRALSGVQVRRETSGGRLITQIRGRCTEIGNEGDWANSSHAYTGWTVSDRPSFGHPGTRRSSASCPADKWVAGVRGETGSYWASTVMRRVRLACHDASAQGLRTGSASTRSAGSTGGTSTGSVQYCPDEEIARGLLVRRGFYVDGLKLRCAPLYDPTESAPELLYPIDDALSATGNWAVSVRHNPGAVAYDICLAGENEFNCFYQDYKPIDDAWAYQGNLQFPVEIPTNRAGLSMRWKARACLSSNNCSNWSGWARSPVVPDDAIMSAPAQLATVGSRMVNFIWQPVTGATAGYQLLVYSAIGGGVYDVYEPSLNPDPSKLYIESVAAGVTSRVLQVPTSLGNDVRWAVLGCASFTATGRQCSLGYGPRSLYFNDTGASFTALLNQSNQTRGNVGALSFQNPRCITCHGVNAAPSTKPNHNVGANCSTCHQSGWHAPPASMDFRNKSSQQLCEMTKDHPDPIHHLKEDALILWSFTAAPQNTTSPAPQNADWNDRIDQWVAAGMPCP